MRAFIHSPVWSTSDQRPALNDNEIHVWCLKLASVPAYSPQELQLGEQQRYQKIQHPEQARRFVNSRMQLRTLLAQYCDIGREPIEIEQSSLGKPFLAPPNQHIEFNLSHTGDIALLAISQSFQVGIDLEFIRPVPQSGAISKRVFPPELQLVIGNSHETDRPDLFFQHWTRMEAAQKTFGKGIFSEKIDHRTVGMYTFSPMSEFIATLAWSDPAIEPKIHFFNNNT